MPRSTSHRPEKTRSSQIARGAEEEDSGQQLGKKSQEEAHQFHLLGELGHLRLELRLGRLKARRGLGALLRSMRSRQRPRESCSTEGGKGKRGDIAAAANRANAKAHRRQTPKAQPDEENVKQAKQIWTHEPLPQRPGLLPLKRCELQTVAPARATWH